MSVSQCYVIFQNNYFAEYQWKATFGCFKSEKRSLLGNDAIFMKMQVK